MQPRVSVIIASCNHERFLGRAVESVLDQTLQDFEILVADDGSTDGSADVVRGFRDPRIRSWLFPHNRHQHPRNHCLDHARGEFVAILNSDDAFHPDKLAKQVRHLEAHPATGVVFSWIEPIDERGARIADSAAPICTWFQEPNRPRHAWLRRLFEGGNHLCHPTAMMRRQLVDEVGRYHPLLALASDLDLWLRLALRAEFHVIPEPLTAVRLLDGEGNASGDRPAIQRRALFELAKALRRLAWPLALRLGCDASLALCAVAAFVDRLWLLADDQVCFEGRPGDDLDRVVAGGGLLDARLHRGRSGREPRVNAESVGRFARHFRQL